MLRLPKFEYLSPKTIEEASSLLTFHRGDAKVIAGGTDLFIRMKRREVKPKYLVGLRGIPDLDCITYDKGEGLRIGPLVTNNAVLNSPLIREKFGLLAETISKMATPEVRNMGTLAGNLCNAAPSADAAPPLMVLGANVKLASSKGERIASLEDFFVGPGETILLPGELLTEIQVPNLAPRTGAAYLKLSRTAMDLAVVGVAVAVSLKDNCCTDIKIALGAVSPTPVRSKKAEEVIKGKTITDELIKEASQIASEGCCPISDIRGSAEYRQEIVRVFTRRAIRQALASASAHNRSVIA